MDDYKRSQFDLDLNIVLGKGEFTGNVASSSGEVITEEEENLWEIELSILDSVRSTTKSFLSNDLQSDTVTAETCNESVQLKSNPELTDLHEAGQSYLKILKSVESSLETALRENRQKQLSLVHTIETSPVLSDKNSRKLYLTCGSIPYFKDSKGFAQPDNVDVKTKKKKRQLLPTDIFKKIYKWKENDVNTLRKAIHNFVVQQKIEKLEKEKGKLGLEKNLKEYKQCLINLEIEKIKNLPFSQVARNVTDIDWLKISTIDFEGIFSAKECESMWNLSVSPDVNSSKWSRDELNKLVSIANKHNLQDWDSIAAELGNRNSFQCCVVYFENNGSIKGKWTKEEDERLKYLVSISQVGNRINWGKVTYYFQSRTLKQCLERYTGNLSEDIKRGNFTKEEDAVLVQGAKKYKGDFRLVSQFIPGRTAAQCRSRFEYLVSLFMPRFSEEEDAKLMLLVSNLTNPNWCEINKYFENRSVVQLRRRWGRLKQGAANDILVANQIADKILKQVKPYHEETVVSLLNKTNGKPGRKKVQVLLTNFEEYVCKSYGYLYPPKDEVLFPVPPVELENKSDHLGSMLLSLSVKKKESQTIDLTSLHPYCKDIWSKYLENQNNYDFKIRCNCLPDYQLFFPPNYGTMLGLRSLLHSRPLIDENAVVPPIFRNPNISNRMSFPNAVVLWKARLQSLFTYAWLLSYFNTDSVSVPPKQKNVKCTRKMSKRQVRKRCKYLSTLKVLRGKNPRITKDEVLDFIEQTKDKNMDETKANGPSKRGRKRKIPTEETNRVKAEMNSTGETGRPTSKVKRKVPIEENVVKKAKMIRITKETVKKNKKNKKKTSFS